MNHFVYYIGEFVTNSPSLRPIPLPCAPSIHQICGGAGYIIILDHEGKVWCVGEGNQGQLGIGEETYTSQFIAVRFPCSSVGYRRNVRARVKAIHSAYDRVTAITEGGQLYVWGASVTVEMASSHSQIISSKIMAPELIKTPCRFLKAVPGQTHIVALAENEAGEKLVYTWGDNRLYQLGRSVTNLEPTWKRPGIVQIPGSEAIVDVAAGTTHSLALTAGGSVWMWGSCLGETELKLEIQHVPGLSKIRKVFATCACSFAVSHSGKIYEWTGSRVIKSIPIELNGSPNKNHFSVSHNCLTVGAKGSKVTSTWAKVLPHPFHMRSVDLQDKEVVCFTHLSDFGLAFVLACKTTHTSLTELIQRESFPPQVPSFFRKLVGFLEGNLNTEGIFRLPGSGEEVAMLQRMIDTGTFQDLNLQAFELFSVATLLKRLLRTLPVPILTFSDARTENIDVVVLCRNMIQQAPIEHAIVLHYLINFLHKVVLANNKMSSRNIALMFSPAIFGDFPDLSPVEFTTVTALASQITDHLITNELESLFPLNTLEPINIAQLETYPQEKLSSFHHVTSVPMNIQLIICHCIYHQMSKETFQFVLQNTLIFYFSDDILLEQIVYFMYNILSKSSKETRNVIGPYLFCFICMEISFTTELSESTELTSMVHIRHDMTRRRKASSNRLKISKQGVEYDTPKNVEKTKEKEFVRQNKHRTQKLTSVLQSTQLISRQLNVFHEIRMISLFHDLSGFLAAQHRGNIETLITNIRNNCEYLSALCKEIKIRHDEAYQSNTDDTLDGSRLMASLSMLKQQIAMVKEAEEIIRHLMQTYQFKELVQITGSFGESVQLIQSYLKEIHTIQSQQLYFPAELTDVTPPTSVERLGDDHSLH